MDNYLILVDGDAVMRYAGDHPDVVEEAEIVSVSADEYRGAGLKPYDGDVSELLSR